jgi:hypothetical protein
MTDRELMQQALSVLCNNAQPRDGFRENRHLVPKSHAAIYQQTIDALCDRLSQPKTPEVTPEVTPYVIDCPRCGHCCSHRPWVGLTKEEAKEISLANRPYVIDMIAALEARLKEKNT